MSIIAYLSLGALIAVAASFVSGFPKTRQDWFDFALFCAFYPAIFIWLIVDGWLRHRRVMERVRREVGK